MLKALKGIQVDERIQNYFEAIYRPHTPQIRQSLFGFGNEIYGELYYYSMKKLFGYLNLSEHDHFLDLGSGLGRIVFQGFLTQNIQSVTGVEINPQRHGIALEVSRRIQEDFPLLFENRRLNLRLGDFLEQDFSSITTIYVCSTVFSNELLQALGSKINALLNVKKIASIRKIPNLSCFKISRKLYLQGTWDYTGCYLYERI